MLTRSSIFAEFAERHGIQTDTVVKITIGANEYFFSYRPMPKGLNTNPIYPILKRCEDIEEGIDIYSKRLIYGSVSITLSDIPFYPSTGTTPKRVSSLLTQINGATVDIYFMAGDEITDIDDCLHIFSGYVLTPSQLEVDNFKFEAENKIRIEDVVIPPRLIRDELPYSATEVKDIPIPLVYGYFHLGIQKYWVPEYILDYPGTGLVKGYPTSGARHSPYIIADHDVISQTACFDLGGPTIVYIEYAEYSFTGSNNRLLVTPTAIENVCMLLFPNSGSLPGIYDDESYIAIAVDGGDAQSRDFKYVRIRDNEVDGGPSGYVSGLALWAFQYPGLFAKHVLSCDTIKAIYTNIIAKAGITVTNISAYLYYGRNDATPPSPLDDRLTIGYAYSGITYGGGPHELELQQKSGKDISGKFMQEYVMAFQAKSIGQGDGDGVLNNEDMLDVDRFHIQLHWTLKERPDEIWCTCWGETFGAIVSEGRSNPGGFSSYDTIEHVIYIIESLYRLQLGFDDDDIDTASFDNCFEEVLEGRINALDQKPMSKYIRELCEQSTFTICHSSVGKVRAVKLNDPDPDIAVTIKRDQLIDDRITVIKLSRIINSLTVHSNWHGEYNKYFDRDSYEDSDSIDTHRTRSAEYKWKYISDDAAEHVAESYVNSVDGLWSKEHIQVTFRTFGLIHSHLEVGDWITLSTDLDDLREPYGGTWNGKSLLITTIKKTDTATEITAVEIIAFEYSPEPSASPPPSPSPIEDGLWLIDDDTDPNNSTLLTGYSALLDGVYNLVACRPFTEGPSVGIDMGEQITLSALRLYDTGVFGAGLKTGARLFLYISNDNATWTYIEQFTSMTRVATGGTYDPYYIHCTFSSNQTARYFKLFSPGEPLKVPAGYSLDLSEIEPTEETSP